MGNTLRGIIESFSRLTDRRALAVEPQRIRIVRVPRAMSARRALFAAGAVPEQLEELALLNHLHLEDRVKRGTLLRSGHPIRCLPDPMTEAEEDGRIFLGMENSNRMADVCQKLLEEKLRMPRLSWRHDGQGSWPSFWWSPAVKVAQHRSVDELPDGLSDHRRRKKE